MQRIGFGLALLSLVAVGCTKQNTTTPTGANAAPPPAQVAEEEAAPQPESAVPAVAVDPNKPWIAAATASDYMLIGQQQQSFGVWVDVPAVKAAHVPTALALAVDTSGSMRGEKIEHARQAARRLVEELEDGDIVSLVTFSERAKVLMSPTIIDAHTRRMLLNQIEELTASGGTAMHDGLRTAESHLWGAPQSHLVRRAVVISDGKATVGPTTPAQLGGLAESGLQQGIQVTSLGVGVDYDELTLNELAVRSSGRLYHVENSEELPSIIEEEIALLDATAASNVEVELVAAPGVHILGTATAQAVARNGNLRVPLGAMFGGQQREILVRAHVDGDGTEGDKVIASVRLHFRDLAQGGVFRVQEAVLSAKVTDDPSLVAEFPNSRTQTLIAMRDATTWTQAASAQLNSGDLAGADAHLARAEERLRRQATQAKTASERKRASSSAKRIAKKRKKIKKAKAMPAPARAASTRRISLDANADAMSEMGY